MVLGEFALPVNGWTPAHVHNHHQLAWAAGGVALVEVGAVQWVLPPNRALWLPAGVVHRTGAAGRAALRGVYLDPARCPVDWPAPAMVAVGPLLRELLEYLTHGELTPPARLRAEAVVFDLLEPVAVAPIGAPRPADPRARRVADALLADPADQRDLADFGREVGASPRHLTRIFRAETGLTFGRWRTQARLRAALPMLAEGMPLAAVARRVGYATPSAFAAAFRKGVGLPPAAYFAG
ncbi:AraC family transcriptional regulator [Amycolatopsis arida]|nr:helix-turn-helix transcriptional regulator [Amycolatopsis arida]